MKRVAFAAAAVYLVVACLYVWSSDRLVSAWAAGDASLQASLQTLKGLGFMIATATIFFILVWRASLASWRAAEAAAARYFQEAHQQALFEHAPEAGFVLEDGRFVAANRAAGLMFRCDPGELLGVHPWELSPVTQPDGLRSREAAWERINAAQEGDVLRFPWRHRRRDGSELDCDVSLTVLPGSPRRVAAWVRDFTEQRDALVRLAEAHEQLRLLIEGTPHFFFYVQDEQARVTYVSPTVEAITGRPPAEWIGQSHWFATESPINETARQATDRHIAGVIDAEPILVEVEHADGHAVLLEVYEHGVLRDGRVVGLQGFAHDITRRARAEKVRAATYRVSEAAANVGSPEELFPAVHAIVGELMPARNLYIALHDDATDLLSFPYFVDEFDPQPAPRRPGLGLTEYVLRKGVPLLATRELLADLTQRGEVSIHGTPPVDWLGVPLKTGGRTIGVLTVQSYSEGVRYGEEEKSILMFVSSQVAWAIERARAEQALREGEERYRRLVELSPDGIVVHVEGRVVFVNQRAVSLLGFTSPSEVLGRQAISAVHPDDRPRVAERIQRMLSLGEEQPTLTERLIRRDGSTFDAEVVASPFTWHGKPAAHVVFRDISERLRLEEHLRQSQRMEAIGGLAGGIAHDFNNLLQAMMGTVQVLRSRRERPDGVDATVTELEAHVKRGATLARQLLLFARRQVTKPEKIDLNAVFRDALELLHRLVRENIKIEVELCPRPIPVAGDVGQLEQVLVNLVVNASDAMPDGGRLTLTSGSDGSAAYFEVRDTGVGMSPELRERIFEPFFSTKRPGEGTGLGLAVVHGIIAQHGGRIEVESEPGKGACFRVVLPYRGTGKIALPVERSELPTSRARGEHVLVVEDEAGARSSLREVLTVLGYHVTAVESGEAAAALDPDEPFDLLLTDLVLPGMHGATLAERLAARWPGLKVVVMSGYTEDEAIRRGVGEGSVRFLQKPFDMDTLARELRGALDEGPTAHEHG